MNSKVASFNYTNRKRIKRENVLIRGFVENSSTKVIIERLDLTEIDVPNGGEVILEISSNRNNLRFPVGNVDEIQIGKSIDLGDVPLEGVTAKIKVVGRSESDNGKLLALCDRLRPEFLNGSQSILPLVPTELGDLVWKLEIDNETGPELQVNSRFDDLYEVYRHPVFLATVMPEVVRQIAFWASQLHASEDDAIAEVLDDWVNFFQLSGHDVRANSGDIDMAQNEAHQIALDFSSKNRYLDLFKTSLEIQD